MRVPHFFLKEIHIPKLSACENITNALTKGAKATPQKNGNITYCFLRLPTSLSEDFNHAPLDIDFFSPKTGEHPTAGSTPLGRFSVPGLRTARTFVETAQLGLAKLLAKDGPEESWLP